jgi:hypothetical protein
MTTRRPLLTIALLAACTGGGASVAAGEPPPAVKVYQGPDSSITEGDVTIPGDPATLYATVLDYKRWPDLFANIAKVEVTSQQGVDAMVTLIAPDGHRDNVHFHNQPQARMIWFEDTHGRADVWVETMFVPGDLPGTTRVHTRLYAEVKGVASLVVSDSQVKNMRQARVMADLAHLRKYVLSRSTANAAR